jgi:hypothetical protein
MFNINFLPNYDKDFIDYFGKFEFFEEFKKEYKSCEIIKITFEGKILNMCIIQNDEVVEFSNLIHVFRHPKFYNKFLRYLMKRKNYTSYKSWIINIKVRNFMIKHGWIIHNKDKNIIKLNKV